MVTGVPTVPEPKDKLVMLGVGRTVKPAPLLASPLTVTTTLPLVAPVGTGTRMVLALQLVGDAVVSLNFTCPLLELPRLLPEIVTDAPTGPVLGDRPVIVGVTVNQTPLLATPFTVTTT